MDPGFYRHDQNCLLQKNLIRQRIQRLDSDNPVDLSKTTISFFPYSKTYPLIKWQRYFKPKT